MGLEPWHQFKPSSKINTDRSKADPFCYLCFVSIKLYCMIIAALWSPAEKGLTSWRSCM